MMDREAIVVTLDGSRTYAATSGSPLGLLMIVAILNGEAEAIKESISELGLWGALISTFNISAIVWLSIFALWKLNIDAVFRLNRVAYGSVVVVSSAMIIYPNTHLSWIALTLMCIVSFGAVVGRAERRVLAVASALAFNGFWSKIIMRSLMDHILKVDAALVGALSGYQVRGNIIQSSDPKVVLQVLEGCSSVANISLALLGFVAANAYFGGQGKTNLLWLGIGVTLIVLVNTMRMSLIAAFPDYYDVIHGDVGSAVTSIIISIIVMFTAMHSVSTRAR